MFLPPAGPSTNRLTITNLPQKQRGSSHIIMEDPGYKNFPFTSYERVKTQPIKNILKELLPGKTLAISQYLLFYAVNHANDLHRHSSLTCKVPNIPMSNRSQALGDGCPTCRMFKTQGTRSVLYEKQELLKFLLRTLTLNTKASTIKSSSSKLRR